MIKKDEKGTQENIENYRNRSRLEEKKERDNLITSILLQIYILEPEAIPKHLKSLVAVQGFEPRTLRI